MVLVEADELEGCRDDRDQQVHHHDGVQQRAHAEENPDEPSGGRPDARVGLTVLLAEVRAALEIGLLRVEVVEEEPVRVGETAQPTVDEDAVLVVRLGNRPQGLAEGHDRNE